MTDTVDNLLSHLRICIEQRDYLAAREAVEEYADTEFDRRLSDLIGTAELAALWNVTRRRAQAHVTWLNERHGIGIQLCGTWFLEKHLAETYKPGKPGNPNLQKAISSRTE